MGDSHSVLGEGSGLVGADGGRGAQSFDSLQVLDEAILGRHALSGQSEAHLC